MKKIGDTKMGCNKNGGGGTQHRESNIELYRIVCMILIVAHHYVVNSGLTSVGGPIQNDPHSWRSIFLLLFGAWGKTGINCFVFITGWFMSKSKITLRKFVKLLAEIILYRIIVYTVFLVSKYEPFSVKTLIQTVIPVTEIESNFTSCFIMYYLAIPFVNKLMDNLDEIMHRRLVILIGFVYIILGTVHQVIFNYFTWFIVLHLLAGYMRRYPKAVYEKKTVWGFMTLTSIILSAASVVIMAWIGKEYGLNGKYYIFVSDLNTILAVVTGISSFLFFKNLNIPYSKTINTIAASTFGVLLIHANSDTMRRWLWKDTLNNVGMYGSDLMIIHAIGSVIGVFTICVLIDQIRIHFLEKPFMAWWDNHETIIVEKARRWRLIRWLGV